MRSSGGAGGSSRPGGRTISGGCPISTKPYGREDRASASGCRAGTGSAAACRRRHGGGRGQGPTSAIGCSSTARLQNGSGEPASVSVTTPSMRSTRSPRARRELGEGCGASPVEKSLARLSPGGAPGAVARLELSRRSRSSVSRRDRASVEPVDDAAARRKREGARVPPPVVAGGRAQRRPRRRSSTATTRRRSAQHLDRVARLCGALRGLGCRAGRPLRRHGAEQPPVPRVLPRRVPRRRRHQPAEPAARAEGARVHPRRLRTRRCASPTRSSRRSSTRCARRRASSTS